MFTHEMDDDTKRFFVIVVDFLVEYFEIVRDDAIKMVNEGIVGDHDFYHHEGAFRSAAIIYYMAKIYPNGNFRTWIKEKGYFQTPKEALQYFQDNYII